MLVYSLCSGAFVWTGWSIYTFWTYVRLGASGSNRVPRFFFFFFFFFFIADRSWAAVLVLVVLWLASWVFAVELLLRSVSFSLSYVVLRGSCAALWSPCKRGGTWSLLFSLMSVCHSSLVIGVGTGSFAFLWSVSQCGRVYCFIFCCCFLWFFQCSCFRPLSSLLLCFINVFLINYILLWCFRWGRGPLWGPNTYL